MIKKAMKERGSAAYQLFLLAISLYVLVVLVLEAFVIRDEQVRLVLQYVDFAICLVFLSDFVLNLFYAEDRVAYLKWGWIDFISSVPAIDPLRWDGRFLQYCRVVRRHKPGPRVSIL
jgi:voltage-gated potassium channel